MQFESNPPWFHAAFEDGNVIRFNGLTGHEQRRFLADVRTPSSRKPRARASPIFTAAFMRGWRHDGRSARDVWEPACGMSWPARRRRKIRYPHAHGGFLALSADGKTLAIADDRQVDRTLGRGQDRPDHVETGEPVLALEAVDDLRHVLAFSPDGTKLLTGLKRGSAIVWMLCAAGKSKESERWDAAGSEWPTSQTPASSRAANIGCHRGSLAGAFRCCAVVLRLDRGDGLEYSAAGRPYPGKG